MRLLMLFVISFALAIAFGFLNSGLGERIKNLKKRKIFYVITTILVIVNIIAGITSIVMMVREDKTGIYKEIKSESIVALQDNQGISGKGSRYYFSINSQQYVTVAIGNSNHYSLKSINGDLCSFYACAGNEEPHIETRQYVVYPDTFFEDYQNFFRYRIYVPKDCLQQGFNIDLQ